MHLKDKIKGWIASNVRKSLHLRNSLYMHNYIQFNMLNVTASSMYNT